MRSLNRGITLRTIVIATLISICGAPCLAQKRAPIPPAQVAGEVRNYRAANEDRIIRELTEFLSIPNVASDTENIQKNAAHLVEMLEARGIETHLLPISGRGPVVFGKLNAPDAKRTVIFYAHYDGQPVDPAAWTDGKPFEPVAPPINIESSARWRKQLSRKKRFGHSPGELAWTSGISPQPRASHPASNTGAQ